MKKYLVSKATGSIGDAFVNEVVSRAGSIYIKIPEGSDLGFDAFIEVVEAEEATGLVLGMQIKCGASYVLKVKDKTVFSVSLKKDDFSYWNTHSFPTALVIVDPEARIAGWMDINAYIANNPNCLTKSTTTVTISYESYPFNTITFKDIFIPSMQQYKRIELSTNESNLFKYLNMVLEDNIDIKINGLVQLVNHPFSRFSKLTCLVLIEQLFTHDMEFREFAIQFLARYIPGSLVSYSPPQDIENYVISLLSRFGKNEIIQLLKTCYREDGRSVHFGSAGYWTGYIIQIIPLHIKLLCDILEDEKTPSTAKLVAMEIAYHFHMIEVLRFIYENYHKIDWDIAEDIAYFIEEDSVNLFKQIDCSTLIEVIDSQGYNTEYLIDILSDTDVKYLVHCRMYVERIYMYTEHGLVRLASSRALERIDRYQIKRTTNT